MVFLITDTQIKEESFLEDIDNLLNTGEVPNIFAADEKSEIMEVKLIYLFHLFLFKLVESLFSLICSIWECCVYVQSLHQLSVSIKLFVYKDKVIVTNFSEHSPSHAGPDGGWRKRWRWLFSLGNVCILCEQSARELAYHHRLQSYRRCFQKQTETISLTDQLLYHWLVPGRQD